MRRLLMSAAILALVVTPVLVTPARAQHGHRDTGAAPTAPAAAQPAPTPATAAQPQATDRGNWQGRGDRGAVQTAAPAAASQQQAPQQQGGRFDRGGQQQGNGDRTNGRDWRGQDRGNFQDRRGQDSRDFNRPGYRGGNNFSNRDNRGYGGPRHDYSSFRDFHRSFNASRHFQAPFYRRPAGWYDHRWGFGEFLPSAFWARDYWLSDYGRYDLPPPPYGAVWVRVGNDALLVDEDSGEVITVEYGVFY